MFQKNWEAGLVYAKLGRCVFRVNDITHSGAEMMVVLVLFHRYLSHLWACFRLLSASFLIRLFFV